MKVFPLRFTRADLAAVPEHETISYFMIGQLHNDIMILMKLILLHQPRDGLSDPENHAAATARSLAARILCGRLSEGSRLLKGRFAATFQDYVGNVDSESKEIFDGLKKYFSKNNIISTIRNKISFHSDYDIMSIGYNSLKNDEPLIDYHVLQQGNTVFFSAEVLMMIATGAATGTQDTIDGLNEFHAELLRISNLFNNLNTSFLKAFGERHLIDKLNDLRNQAFEIGPQPNLEEFRSPVFLIVDEAKSTK